MLSRQLSLEVWSLEERPRLEIYIWELYMGHGSDIKKKDWQEILAQGQSLKKKVVSIRLLGQRRNYKGN